METKIYVDLSVDLKQVLDDNKLSIDDLLKENGIEAIVKYEALPYPNEGDTRNKDVVTIIMASSGLIASISFAISKILNTLYNRPYFVEYYEYEVVRDGDKIIKNGNGDPIIRSVKKFKLFEPRKEIRKNNFEYSTTAENGIVIKFSTEEKELDSKANK